MPSSIILGISQGHGDSSAALVVDGVLLAAVEEERFTRIKHYALFPHHAIAYCLKHAGLTAKDVQVVAIPREPRNALFQRLKTVVRYPGLLSRKKVQRDTGIDSLEESLEKADLSHCEKIYLEHHLAHMMSVRYLGAEEDTAFLSFDGLGDFVSAAIGHGTKQGVEIVDRVYFPHSLGFFYNAMTQYLGFPYFGDEFKVMGLSSYGKPAYVEALRKLVYEKERFGFSLNLDAFPVVANAKSFYLEGARPSILPFFNGKVISEIVGVPPRKGEPLTQVHYDLAKSVQVRFEEVANHLLRQLHSRFPVSKLALSGGCAHNSVWVGKIPKSSSFKKVVVAPASHDAGLAVGAAISASGKRVTPEKGSSWALLGPSQSESPHAKAPLDLGLLKVGDDNGLIQFLAEALSQGKIIGLFHGRMEFGPRALGSRSILCDPRPAEMRDKLNARVKHRESFRPFAASVLWDHQMQWFKDSFFCPAMEAVFQVQESKAKEIQAVTHVDGSCRIQSIREEESAFFYKLIDAFRKITGVPMLLNTSFNDCEPIVCTEKDAFQCFENCEMDYLVIGNRLFGYPEKHIVDTSQFSAKATILPG